jgi:EamA domain-containing membrane protein RarD
MPFGTIILIRVLFIACMVFIIGYVFGNFSTKPALRTITKVASILAIVLFIASNILFFRFAVRDHHAFNGHTKNNWCVQDTTDHR